MIAKPSPERLLEDLNPSQREAVTATSGPLAIIAGAGSGKTRVVSRRAAYAIETGVVPADQILLVTFTDKAAAEMVERMASLGHRGVMARTFHAAALAQLRHFWPSRHEGAPMPATLESKLRLLVPLVGRLPGGYRFRLPRTWPTRSSGQRSDGSGRSAGRTKAAIERPIPPELFARLFRDYEREKARAGLLDFEDMLVETVELLEGDDEARAARSIAQALAQRRRVPGHEPAGRSGCSSCGLACRTTWRWSAIPDQTIYTFAGATPDYLLGFAERHPGARMVALAENYRSSPQILELANRVAAGGLRGELRATGPTGRRPSVRRLQDAEAELRAIVEWIRSVAAASVAPTEIAVLVRINAQLPPIEDALTRAEIAFSVRGLRFFERREIRDARALCAGSDRPKPAAGWSARSSGFRRETRAGRPRRRRGPGRRERAASLELLVSIVDDLANANPALDIHAVLEELDRRHAAETAAGTDGVNLLTYHRAKGLEWDAVYLPALDEGILPIRQAKEDEEVAEERRLLYVGITRARKFLAVSSSSRRPSRFLAALEPQRPGARRVRVLPGAPIATAAPRARTATRWKPCAAGGGNAPRPTACRPMWSPTTPPWPRSPTRGHGRCPRCAASGAWALRNWNATVRRSSPPSKAQARPPEVARACGRLPSQPRAGLRREIARQTRATEPRSNNGSPGSPREPRSLPAPVAVDGGVGCDVGAIVGVGVARGDVSTAKSKVVGAAALAARSTAVATTLCAPSASGPKLERPCAVRDGDVVSRPGAVHDHVHAGRIRRSPDDRERGRSRHARPADGGGVEADGRGAGSRGVECESQTRPGRADVAGHVRAASRGGEGSFGRHARGAPRSIGTGNGRRENQPVAFDVDRRPGLAGAGRHVQSGLGDVVAEHARVGTRGEDRSRRDRSLRIDGQGPRSRRRSVAPVVLGLDPDHVRAVRLRRQSERVQARRGIGNDRQPRPAVDVCLYRRDTQCGPGVNRRGNVGYVIAGHAANRM